MSSSEKTIKAAMFSRREILKASAGAAIAGAAVSSLPMPLIAGERSIKIGSYGGYFEDSFKAHVYPVFTEATGIKVESVTQPNSSDWLVTMQQSAASGTAPADLSLYAKDTMIKGTRLGDLITPLDEKKIPAASNLTKDFVFTGDKGLLGVGAMAWFTSMVVNSKEVDPLPTSWAAFWEDSSFESSLGLSKVFNSRLIDIAAAVYFDGAKTLDSDDGIAAAIEKCAELKKQVSLWWTAESQMEQAIKNEDVIGGMYFHDVAGLMAADGFPVASIFPKEGNPIGYGSWCLSPISEKSEEAMEFINFSSDPATQALMSRKIGTAPLLEQSKTDLTDDEFAGVSGTPFIQPNYEAYLDKETFIKDRWEAMLADV